MMLSLESRETNDARLLGEINLFFTDEVRTEFELDDIQFEKMSNEDELEGIIVYWEKGIPHL